MLTVLYVVGALLAFPVFCYLLVALLYPERFS